MSKLVVVYGPPCSGKTTYVGEVLGDKDIYFDFDEILSGISNLDIHGDRRELLKYGLAIREVMIDLSYDDNEIENCYIISCKINNGLLDQLADREVEYVLIDKTKDEVLEQLENDDTREDKDFWKDLIDEWYEWYDDYQLEVSNIKNRIKKYYSMVVEENIADVYIYGDITSWRWFENDVSAYSLAQEIKDLEVDTINVYINSYGGEVAEGLAIYNSLKRHKAKVKTFCDGFACSAASIIFSAGDERLMCESSFLMIHNATQWVAGTSEELHKQADDLEKINQSIIDIYVSLTKLSEEEVKDKMNYETWITPDEALDWGFAHGVVNMTESKVASQNVRKKIAEFILGGGGVELVKSEPVDEPVESVEPEPIDEPTADEPQENKVQKLMTALVSSQVKGDG